MPMKEQCRLTVSPEQLKLIEEYAANLMAPEEIAVLIRIEPQDRKLFCQMCQRFKEDPIFDAYHRGRLVTKNKFRKTTIRMAESGSPAAAPIVEKMLKNKI